MDKRWNSNTCVITSLSNEDIFRSEVFPTLNIVDVMALLIVLVRNAMKFALSIRPSHLIGKPFQYESVTLSCSRSLCSMPRHGD
jgi:hypothetical protein